MNLLCILRRTEKERELQRESSSCFATSGSGARTPAGIFFLFCDERKASRPGVNLGYFLGGSNVLQASIWNTFGPPIGVVQMHSRLGLKFTSRPRLVAKQALEIVAISISRHAWKRSDF